MLRKGALIASLMLYSIELLAQRYPFISYTPSDGLVNNAIRSIYQDSKGRLYFLTRGGLSVHDGARFTNYTIKEGLAQDIVNDILEITPDSFWVATNTSALNCLVGGQINTVHTADGKSPLINKFFKSPDGRLFAACDDGLYVWQKDRFRKLATMYEGAPEDFLIDVKQLGKFLLLLVNPTLGPDPGSILLYDPNTQQVLHRYNEIKTSQWETSPSGDVWLSAADGITMLKKSDLEQGIFRKQPIPIGYSSIRNENPTFFSFDQRGRLWMSLAKVGVRLYEPGKPSIEYSESNGLANGQVTFIFHDREGNHWLIPEGSAAQKLVNTNITVYAHPFGETNISDVFAVPGSDSVWGYAPYTGKLILVKGEMKKVFDMGFRTKNPFKVMVQGNSVYLYNQTELARCEFPEKGAVTKKVCSYEYPVTEAAFGTFDANGNLVYCTGSTIRTFFKDCSSFLYPANYFVDKVIVDRKGVLWAMSRSGKIITLTTHPEDRSNYLQLKDEITTDITLDNARILEIDPAGRIWISTRFQGIYCFSLAGNHLTKLYHLKKENGLSDNFINSMSIKGNFVWVSSPSGLDRIHLQNGRLTVENITERNKVYASLRKVVVDKSDNVWALGESGNLVQVRPDSAFQAAPAPVVFISSIKVGNQLFAGGQLDGPLKYSQNDISFYVAAPSFYDEKQIRYSYILEGSNNSEWSEPVSDAAFHFVNLAPGNYKLKVKSEFPAGRYPPALLSYSFEVRPAWWQTWWFRLLMSLALTIMLVAIVRRYYRLKLVRERALLEKQRAIEKERTRIATDMHDDLGAGLSRIKYLSQSIQLKKPDDETVAGDVQKIAAYSDEMVEKMGEIVWALNEKNDSINHLIAFTRSYASDYLSAHDIRCNFESENKLTDSFVTGEIRRNVFLSVKETLHNVVKHAEAKSVTVSMHIDSHLKVVIHDDGIGINWKSIRPFSNGLTNIKKRMEEIGGKVNFENTVGTTVILDIPFNR